MFASKGIDKHVENDVFDSLHVLPSALMDNQIRDSLIAVPPQRSTSRR